MNERIPNLRDIEGIDPVSIWPLGLGWWILICMSVLTAFLFIVIVLKRRNFLRSWKYDTLKKIDFLEERMTQETARESLIQLSEYLRRIAIFRYSRKECAGLFGDQWLEWLKQHDPKGFDWKEKGKILVDAPYAPEKSISLEQVKEYITAVKRWIR